MADSGFKTGSVWGVGEEGSKHCGWFPMVKKKKKSPEKTQAPVIFQIFVFSQWKSWGEKRRGSTCQVKPNPQTVPYTNHDIFYVYL